MHVTARTRDISNSLLNCKLFGLKGVNMTTHKRAITYAVCSIALTSREHDEYETREHQRGPGKALFNVALVEE